MTSTTARRIAVAGASGRMGRMLIEAVGESTDAVLAGALDVAASPAIGQDATAFLGRASGGAVTADPRAGLAGCDVLIDFTRPEGTLAHARVCAELGVQMVIGTTGFDEAGKAALAQAAERVAIVFSPNMSVGVNVTMKLLELAAKALTDG
jgi:4-hydroxy-tetrahydrodipicolinate reductase